MRPTVRIQHPTILVGRPCTGAGRAQAVLPREGRAGLHLRLSRHPAGHLRLGLRTKTSRRVSRSRQYFVAGMIAVRLHARQLPVVGDQHRRGTRRRHPQAPRGHADAAGRYFLGKIGTGPRDRRRADRAPAWLSGRCCSASRLPDSAGNWLTLAGSGCSASPRAPCSASPFSSCAALRTSRGGGRDAAVVLVLQFISGVFFVFSELPTWMQRIAALFPLKWMAQGMRSVFLPDSFATQEPAASGSSASSRSSSPRGAS